ncbi:hypothetical protein C8R47DRAFT_1227672 [Mycena vitilis]|nr:hypothetical protein C8R47DRAFT_1227672 [Mycena vitilis]
MPRVCAKCGHIDENDPFAPSLMLLDMGSETASSSPPHLRTQLEVIRLVILRHKTFLEALEEKQSDVELELSRIVYPVVDLPPELISQAFVACLPDPGRSREIALSLPELWASVDLRLTPGTYG